MASAQNDTPSVRAVHKSSSHSRDTGYKGRPMDDIQHKIKRHSLLSTLSPQTNLKGFFNLLILVVVAQNFRLVIENLLKYGVLVRFLPSANTFHTIIYQWPSVIAFIVMHLIVVGSFLVERYISPTLPALPLNFRMLFLKLALCGSMIGVPHMAVRLHAVEPIAVTVLLLLAITWCLKLVSYHHTLWDLRLAKHKDELLANICGSEEERLVAEQYPQCLTLYGLMEFMIMPTICFQLQYPRTQRIRWLRVLRHSGELVVCVVFIKIIIEQYMTKIVENTFTQLQLQEMAPMRIAALLLERLLKLSIPTLLVWLLLFVGLFHHWMNILGEITRFGDRAFYSDWWNAGSFGEYWRKWNLPIHNYCARHIQRPLYRLGVPKFVAGYIVFFLSALAHEYLVVVPLRIGWNGLVFTSFMFQVPLMMLTSGEYFKTPSFLGNGIFWVSFSFTGQPLALMVYYYVWATQQGMDEPLSFGRDLQTFRAMILNK